jgi:hypothetical protein
MKKVNVKNPAPMGRLAIANSSPAITKGKAKVNFGKKNGSKNASRRNPAPDVKMLFMQAVAAAVGGMLVTTAASKLPLPTNPYMNILSKFGLSYALAYLAEKVSYTKNYSMSLGIGGASVAASDAIKIAVPSLRTIFLSKPEEAVKVVTQTDAQGEPIAIADAVGMDELGDMITMNERYVGGLGDTIEELGEMYMNDIVTPGWAAPQRQLPARVR